jgi:Undecaprenyl-phosphate galactose phosphotransferase WbaP
VGFLGDSSAERDGTLPGGPAGEAPWLGPLAVAEKVMASTGARTVVVASPHTPGEELVHLVNRLHRSAGAVLVVPDLPGMPVLGVETEPFFDHQVLLLRVRNNLSSPMNRILKGLFDFAGGLVLLLLASPVFLLVALAVKVDSPGPVFFSHERVGRGKRLFRCWKFRTMVEDAQGRLAGILEKDPELRREWAQDFKLRDDPRVTRVGRLLRRSSLDELPQLINVLAGQMSLVGPRPIVREEMERFGASLSTYLGVRPGVTGLWQVSGRTETDYQRRVDLEAWYVRNWTFWLDITILLQTVGAVLRRRGAY